MARSELTPQPNELQLARWLGAFCLCQQLPLCVGGDLLCKRGLVVGSEEGDTDLPLINTDGDQGERQDDEDGSSHINHPYSSLACVFVCVWTSVCNHHP